MLVEAVRPIERGDHMLRADDVAAVIIARSGPWIDVMSVQKLLFYAQAWKLAITDEPLFAECFEAWPEGPVLPSVLLARQGGWAGQQILRESAQVALSDEASNLLTLVLRTYGSLSADQLEALVKTELPWQEARADLPEGARGAELISEQSMAQFFRSHRRLDGRNAAFLATVGIHVWESGFMVPPDIDAFIESLGPEFSDPGDHPWGSSNLDPGPRYDGEGTEEERRPADTGA